MTLSFRAKLLVILGVSALTFLGLVTISTVLGAHVADQLRAIREHYLPQVELGPRLEGHFERLRRGMQDAVAAQDPAALAATEETKRTLLRELGQAKQLIAPADAEALRAAIESYYTAARAVSERMLTNETGEALTAAIVDMQAKHARAGELLRAVATFDERELSAVFNDATETQTAATRLRFGISVGYLALAVVLAWWLSRGFLQALGELSAGFARFGRGEFGQPIRELGRDELGELARQANQMAQSLQHLSDERDRADWLKNGRSGLLQELRGERAPEEVATLASQQLARYLEAPAAALYVLGEDDALWLRGHYAGSFAGSDAMTRRFAIGEGLVGQAARDQQLMVVSELPADYLRVHSGLGAGAPRVLVLLPIVHLGRTTAVLELALLKPWSDLHSEFLLSIQTTLGIALEMAHTRSSLRALLAETQAQAERLRAQEEELRANNEELHGQQEELRQINTALTRQTVVLEDQRRTLEQQNVELTEARQTLEHKAKELTTVSAYKTQFLANMSHELRTPLNSMLLLSSLLAENDSKNLSEKQVEYCKTIHGAGRDLLGLINQVLDLAKVEAGKQDVSLAPVPLQQLADHATRMFEPLARDKGLALVVELAGTDVPEAITTDRKRIEQILNNLLGNAIKFTETGRVSLRIGPPKPGTSFRRSELALGQVVALEVADTGVGIAREHQERVFVPFEQIETSADRRYGGTGLGLTIAREFVELLGGELQLHSTPGQGSVFTCYLPFVAPRARQAAADGGEAAGAPRERAPASAAPTPVSPQESAAERPTTPDDALLLVVEDDPVFAGVLADILREQGLRHLLARDGQAAIRLAREQRPSGIILDVKLSGMDGFMVMDALRTDPATANIPVHFISAVESADRALAMGAVGYLTKPATRQQLIHVVESLAPRQRLSPYRILIAEEDVALASSLAEELKPDSIEVRRATSARETLEILAREDFSCLVLDLGLPDMDGLELLEKLQEQPRTDRLPVVVYTGRALSKAETQRLEAYTEAVVLKGGPGAQRLLDELRLFIRRLKDGRSSRGRAVNTAHVGPVRLEGRHILLTDDDMRTVYALSALLRAKGAEVLTADTGRAALEVLAEHPEIEVVLMDIMMPEMDGYEAMRRIRQDPRHAELPIIALTAKAMRMDREKCLEAGASEYLSKPVDAERLFALLHALLNQGPKHGAGTRS